MPDVVKYGISNLTLIGGRVSASSVVQREMVERRTERYTAGDAGKVEVGLQQHLLASLRAWARVRSNCIEHIGQQ
jgi:hypothetical protein